MSTPVIALTTAEAAVDRGWETWHNAMNAMWPESIRNAIRGPAGELLDALELYSELLNEDIRPADAYDGLEGDALAVALERAAQAVSERAAGLVRVFPACSTEGGN